MGHKDAKNSVTLSAATLLSKDGWQMEAPYCDREAVGRTV